MQKTEEERSVKEELQLFADETRRTKLLVVKVAEGNKKLERINEKMHVLVQESKDLRRKVREILEKESSTQKQTKSRDATSSKDLKVLLTHSDDESGATTVTRSSSAANTVRSSSQTPMLQNEAVQNQSFRQASLGEISSSELQQSQLSSSQNRSLTPPQDGQSNATENIGPLPSPPPSPSTVSSILQGAVNQPTLLNVTNDTDHVTLAQSSDVPSSLPPVVSGAAASPKEIRRVRLERKAKPVEQTIGCKCGKTHECIRCKCVKGKLPCTRNCTCWGLGRCQNMSYQVGCKCKTTSCQRCHCYKNKQPCTPKCMCWGSGRCQNAY